MRAAAVVQLKDCNSHGGALKLHRGAIFGEVSIAPLQQQSLAILPISKAGTALAISNLSLGVAADLPCSTGRGGARNRADRESHALTAAHVANLRAAERHAATIGLPFTRMITIHWEAAGVPLASMAKATGRFTGLLAKFLARNCCRSAWIWTHENAPRQTGDKGGHCHLLVHVPREHVKALTALQKGWLRSITGNPYRAGVIYSEPIGGRLGLERGNPALHLANLQVTISYICKGARQSVLDANGIDRRHKPGGRVIGKRCGASQNVGPKARQ